MIKIVVTGDDGVGKTAIINQFINGAFEYNDPDEYSVKFIQFEDKQYQLEVLDALEDFVILIFVFY